MGNIFLFLYLLNFCKRNYQLKNQLLQSFHIHDNNTDTVTNTDTIILIQNHQWKSMNASENDLLHFYFNLSPLRIFFSSRRRFLSNTNGVPGGVFASCETILFELKRQFKRLSIVFLLCIYFHTKLNSQRSDLALLLLESVSQGGQQWPSWKDLAELQQTGQPFVGPGQSVVEHTQKVYS